MTLDTRTVALIPAIGCSDFIDTRTVALITAIGCSDFRHYRTVALIPARLYRLQYRA